VVELRKQRSSFSPAGAAGQYWSENHSYRHSRQSTTTRMIPSEYLTMVIAPTVTDEASTLKGDVESPSRKVLTSILASLEQVNKQSLLEKFTTMAEHKCHNYPKPKRQGRRTRNRLKHNKDEPYHAQITPSVENIWAIHEVCPKLDKLGSPQPEVELNDDASLFTRTTDLHNSRRVAEILKNVLIGAIYLTNNTVGCTN
jgi:hypothetical protein